MKSARGCYLELIFALLEKASIRELDITLRILRGMCE